MSIKRLLLVAILVGAAVVVLTTPQAKQLMGQWFHAVKEDAGPGEHVDAIGTSVKVFLPRNAPYYHRRDCPEMEGLTGVPTPLDKAKGVARPCPVCNPPTSE